LAGIAGSSLLNDPIVAGVAFQNHREKLLGLRGPRRPALLQAYEAPAIDPAVKEAPADYVARREHELQGQNLYE
jgi:hypothetical protein